jgi:hypothetical protein
MHLFAALAYAVATNWVPSCPARDAANLWFVFEGKPPEKDAPAPPDFVCQGLFMETVACPNSVGMGKVTPLAPNSIGQKQYELRYLPYGETTQVMGFMDKEGGGVLFKPLYTPATPSLNDPPPDAAELFRQYLIQRKKASQATQGITVHTWTCPNAEFYPPTEEMDPNGMKLVRHTARAPL